MAERNPRLIASLMVGARGADACLPLVRSAAAEGADTIELRLDEARPEADPRLIEAAHAAGCLVIATCRRVRDGGAWEGSEPDRAARLRAAESAGADFLDLEHDSDISARLPGPSGRSRRIVSLHDTTGTPEDLPSVAARLRARGGGLVKLVTTARSLRDTLSIRNLLRSDPGGAAPLIAFAMGPRGLPSRLLALAWGSAAAYFAADPLDPAASGQIGLEEAVNVHDVAGIGTDTTIYGITGCPLAHTLSPRLHNAAFRACGLDARYLPFESDSYDDFLEVAGALDIAGYSVTVPHKIAAARRTDQLDEAARAIGAVNTVLRRAGVAGRRGGPVRAVPAPARTKGFNTDAPGSLAVLRRRVRLEGTRVLLVGAGGAARAVAFALIAAGADLHILDRTASRARDLAGTIGGRAVDRAGVAGLRQEVLVNATSVGMEDPDQLPLPAGAISGRLVFDLVYGSRRTRLLREAQARGIECLDGREMLLEQALLQFALWTGLEGQALDRARAAMTVALPADPGA